MVDSLYNIWFLREFFNEYFNKCFYFILEDMLYVFLVLKLNVMVFIVEFFWWFENVKLDFVQFRDVQELKDVKIVLYQKSSWFFVFIFNVIKCSFLGSFVVGILVDLQFFGQLLVDGCYRYYLYFEEFEYFGKGIVVFSLFYFLLLL